MSVPSKRPRHSGSFSPASPPYHHQQTSQTKPVTENPQTPISPTTMATSTQPYASSTSNSINTATSAFTPATSATDNSFLVKDSEGDAIMTDEPEAQSEGDGSNPSDSGGEANSDAEVADSGPPTKRRRTDHDWHTREPTARPEFIRDRLSAEMGPMYKLLLQPAALSRPHPSQNLMSMFKLNDIATTVRRVDPTTGEKINKIRKSYEGKVKALSVAGRNKAISTPGQWVPQGLFRVPEDDYRATRVLGKEIEKGLTDAFMAKLDRAVQMAPGKLPEREAEKWKALIGTEEPAPQVKAKTAMDASRKPGPLPLSAAAASMRSASSPAASKLARPERTGTKRRYNDSSFKGYGEGFLDDEDVSDEDARSTTSGGIKKKRRKEYSVTSPLGQQATSYGVGLVAGGPRR